MTEQLYAIADNVPKHSEYLTAGIPYKVYNLSKRIYEISLL